MQKTTNIFIAGVGGQGILKFSDILSEVALLEGLDIKKSEVHGMSQRGGSVTSHVRFGDVVYSPLIEKGKADILVALEQIEAVRHISYLNPQKGVLIYDPLKIPPPDVNTGLRKYPENIDEILKNASNNVIRVEAFKKATELGNYRAQNTIILGIISHFLTFDDKTYEKAIEKVLPKKTIDFNIKAFYSGKELK